MKILTRVLLILTFLGFVIASVVHIMTFVGVNLGGLPFLQSVYSPNLVLVLAFVAMIILSAQPKAGINSWSNFWGRMPLLLRGTILVLSVYVVIVFALSFNSDTPAKQEDKYVLTKRGEVVRELTEAEYQQQQFNIVRYRSGIISLFYLIPTLYFWYFDPTEDWWSKLLKREETA
jgi:hypothetical protein